MSIAIKTSRALALALACLTVAAACSGGSDDDEPALKWSLLQSERPGALLSVWGTRHDDVWVVGGDQQAGMGPTVLRYDGAQITSLSTGVAQGNLWWVTGSAAGDPVYMGGEDGLLLRYADGAFERMKTPSSATIYGLWVASADDVWAVGGAGSNGAFAWRLQAGEWRAAEGFEQLQIGDETKAPIADVVSLRKVWGTGPDDVWMVGTAGTVVHYDGAGFSVVPVPHGEDLFTVHADGSHVATVGGVGSGVIYERDGSGFRDATPRGAPELTGVWLRGDGGYAVGGSGEVYARHASGWTALDTGSLVTEDLHSVWVDENGCVFSAGGRWRAYPLTRGLLLHGCK